MKLPVDDRPVVVALAGPNGAGKTTFNHSHLGQSGIRLVNADVLAAELGIDPFAGARAADLVRRHLIDARESFVFETVFSDPAGSEVGLLREAVRSGYTVVVCFVSISGPATSDQRVAMRGTKGGHDVPADRLRSRFPRMMANLKVAGPCRLQGEEAPLLAGLRPVVTASGRSAISVGSTLVMLRR